MRVEAVLRWKGAGQSWLTALRRANCELTAQLVGMWAAIKPWTASLDALFHPQTTSEQAIVKDRTRRRSTSNLAGRRTPFRMLGLPALFHQSSSGRQSGHRPEIAKTRRSSLRWTLVRQSSNHQERPSHLGRSRSAASCGWRGSDCSGGCGQRQTLHPVPEPHGVRRGTRLWSDAAVGPPGRDAHRAQIHGVRADLSPKRPSHFRLGGHHDLQPSADHRGSLSNPSGARSSQVHRNTGMEPSRGQQHFNTQNRGTGLGQPKRGSRERQSDSQVEFSPTDEHPPTQSAPDQEQHLIAVPQGPVLMFQKASRARANPNRRLDG